MNNQKAGKNKQQNLRKPIEGLPSRQTAARLLGAVVDKKTSLDGLTDHEHGHPQYLALPARDRALVKAILATALRHRGDIETRLGRYLERPLPKGAKALHHLLHIATAQIVYLDVPDHAAIHLAVAASKQNPQLQRFSGLVNAVLRRVSANKAAAAPAAHAIANAPQWFGQMLQSAYGQAKAQAILAAQQYEPPIDLTVKATPRMWAQKLGGYVLANGTVRLARLETALTELPGFAEGAWWVQDVAASLPARLLGDIRGQRIADLCSAPGGKTAQLALAGAHVTAVDLSTNRLKRLQQNMSRLGFAIETCAGDFRHLQPQPLFDTVLLDAPCSSTGTIRRHPDVLWNKDADDISRLAALQAELLAAAIGLTRQGGTLVFCNCSLAPSEGEELVRTMLDSRQDVELVPVLPQELPGLSHLITAEGFLRTTPADLPHDNPQLGGMDGFFAARLRRL